MPTTKCVCVTNKDSGNETYRCNDKVFKTATEKRTKKRYPLCKRHYYDIKEYFRAVEDMK